MVLKQRNRLLAVATPLGPDVLVLTAFRGREEISRPFCYQLDLLSDNASIAAKQVVGKDVTVSIRLADGSSRYFHGFVSRFVAGNEADGRRDYRAEVVPWLWFLTRTSDCRIFQKKTAVQIIEKIFDDLGFSDYETSEIKGSHATREYCVQYRETDFDFVSRLMEQEGIFYYFRHEDGKHTLVLADQKGAYKDCPENEVDYPDDVGTQAVADHISSWEHRWEFTPGKWAQTDYNFEDHPARSEPKPADLMMTGEQTTVQLENIQKYEVYDYPGSYAEKGAGQDLTKIRMEEEETAHDAVVASSTCRTFTPGGKFKIASHRSKSEEGKTFAITAIDHVATEPSGYETGDPIAEDYSNKFTCIPDSVTFRPRRQTPKPVIRGSQTAVVVGPAGEEIWPDKHGRVKVQFFWDREGKRDENSSCWIRCMQTIAGKGWGAMFIPRIGQEVIVSYLEGDPDRPLITGLVYNADQTPPYKLPDEKTKSTIKTRSTKDGTDDNYNEIRFEDKKGSEQLLIHAEKNQDIEVENDETHWVGHDRKKTVDRDESTKIKRDRTETVDRNEQITIVNNRTESVGKEESISIGTNRAETVGKNEDVNIGQNRTVTIGKDETVEVAGKREQVVGKDDQVTIGKKLLVTVGDEIVLKTGKASITMKKNGDIQIKGNNITLSASGKINAKASGKVTIKGSQIVEN